LDKADDALKLDPKTTKFSPEVQDRLAMWVLKQQGFGAWQGFKGNPKMLQFAQEALAQNKVGGYTNTPPSVSSGYGVRTHPITGEHRMHKGIDIKASRGTPILAYDSGVVKMARSLNGYGNVVYLQQDNGFETRYTHMDSLLVREGMIVTKGQPLGTLGSTGGSTGNHLHFEVRKGDKPINPTSYYNERPWIVGGSRSAQKPTTDKANPTLQPSQQALKEKQLLLLEQAKQRKTKVVVIPIEKKVPVTVPNTRGGQKLSSLSSGNPLSKNYYG